MKRSKKKPVKRLCSLLLILVMIMGMLPARLLAKDGGASNTYTVNETVIGFCRRGMVVLGQSGG